MTIEESPHNEATWPQALMRGTFRRCPQCGDGPLFIGYLKTIPTCPVCGFDVARINRGDDGPAFITMSLVLCLILPVILWANIHYDWPLIPSLTYALLITGAASLVLLPLVKGAFIAALWKAKTNNKQ